MLFPSVSSSLLKKAAGFFSACGFFMVSKQTFRMGFSKRLPIFWICGIINNSEEKGGGMP